MPHPLEPCDLHELTGCSICTGVDRTYSASLVEQATTWEDTPVPRRIEGGPTIRARFAGHCAGCGRSYPPGEPIHRPAKSDGWLAVECCA